MKNDCKHIAAGWGCKLAMLVCVAMTLAACNRSADEIFPDGGNTGKPGEKDESDVEMVLLASKKGNLLSDYTWQDDNTLGLFLTKGVLSKPYRDDRGSYYNVKATMRAGLWRFKPENVWLNDEKAVIYAYSPYANKVDPYALPVETESHTLYMYGTHLAPQTSVCNIEYKASVEMRYALGLIDIYVRKTPEFKSKANLQQITIEGRNDSIRLPIKGTMDITTGDITPTGFGKYELDKLDKVIPEKYGSSCMFRLTTIPRDNAEGEIRMSIVVNGVRLSVLLDGEHDWQAGVRNVYNLIFDGYDLRVESVTIKPYTEVYVEDGELSERESLQNGK